MQYWAEVQTTLRRLRVASGVHFLWILFVIFGLLPAFIAFVYYNRRLGTRRSLLLQTILSMQLDDAYMRMRHGQRLAEWRDLPDEKSRMQAFENSYFNEDFHADTAVRDYALPVLLFTILSSLGWLFVLHRLASGMSLLQVPQSVFPDAWAFGFVGAYLACLLTFFDRFRQYDLDPSVYYLASYRLVLNSVVAYLVSFFVKDNFTPLIAFGVGLLPIQQTLSFITEKTSKALGATPSSRQPGEELTKIQGLEDENNRQMLLDIGIHTVQALSTADPLLIFFRTTMPLRTVVDLIDKACLYGYIGDKVVDLRKHGINGAIEMMALGKMADKASMSAAQGGLAGNSLFQSINQHQLISDIAADIGQSTNELRTFIYTLYNDPLVTFISDIWGRTLPQSTAEGNKALAATIKEKAAQIQKVSAQLRASQPALHVVNNP